MPRDGVDRAVIDALDDMLGESVARVVRRDGAWPRYEVHLRGPHAALDARRVALRLERVGVVTRMVISWHVLAGPEARRRWSEPGRLLYPALYLATT